MKLNGTHQLMAYADYVNILGGSIHNLKENADVLVAATREIGLEVNADKTKYVGGSKIFRTGAAICTAVVLAPITGRW